MTWNYRIVELDKADDEELRFGVYEVYYDDDGRPWARTANPISFTGETVDEVRDALARASRPLTVLKDSEIDGKAPGVDEIRDGTWVGGRES